MVQFLWKTLTNTRSIPGPFPYRKSKLQALGEVGTHCFWVWGIKAKGIRYCGWVRNPQVFLPKISKLHKGDFHYFGLGGGVGVLAGRAGGKADKTVLWNLKCVRPASELELKENRKSSFHLELYLTP